MSALSSGPGRLGDVQRRTAHEIVLDRLRVAILQGVLAPGTQLRLSELSDELGTSRTPIREAIRDLATEGLVDFDAYRSPVVHVPTLEEALEIYELRLTLEAIAVRDAIEQVTDEELDRAEALHARMLEVRDVGEWVEMNKQFHAMFMVPVRSKRLKSVLSGLRDAAAVQVARSIRARPDRMAEGDAEHASIIAAFRHRDADLAVARTKQHLRSTLEIIQAYESGEGSSQTS